MEPGLLRLHPMSRAPLIYRLGILMVVASYAPAQFTRPRLLVTNLADSGPGSLRQAIAEANAAPGADVIDFAPGLTGAIAMADGEMIITDSVTINGPGARLLTVNGNRASRVFHIEGPLTVTISGLTISNGLAQSTTASPGAGGGIAISGSTVNLSNLIVSSNIALAGLGGGIWLTTGTLNVANTILLGNQAIGVDGNTVGGCIGCGLGGGLANVGGTLTVDGSMIAGNRALGVNNGSGSVGGLGGGIYSSGPISISNTVLQQNVAQGGSGNIIKGNFLGTNTCGLGGGLYLVPASSYVTITGSTFTGNQAIGGNNNLVGGNGAAGGGIYNGNTST